jgi:UDP-2,3-diacylglucosamine hydrolase
MEPSSGDTGTVELPEPGEVSTSHPPGWWCVSEESHEPPPRNGKKARTVVISDVHIGTNAPTCWYQRAHHEGYLAALLDYVVHHAKTAENRIGGLVILGDLFDFWTYPPDERPPSIDDIIAANERILGDDGKLAKAVAAVDGNVALFRGNHDIQITQAELDRIPLGGYQIPLVEDVLVDDRHGLLLTHGHLFTMFNAPDARYPGEVPVGHFVTRAIMHMLQNMLASSGKTAADFSDQGSPYGFDLPSLAPGLLGQLAGPSVTSILLDYMAARCGLSEAAPILMADGSSTTIRDVKKKYDGLWEEWVNRHGGGEVGEIVAAKAVMADYVGDYMAWFAQKTAWEHSARGAVTGHTHHPKQGIANSTCLYVNCGFECPADPDILDRTQAFTFGMIDADGTPSLWCVVKRNGTYCVGPFDGAPPDRVVYPPFSDFSCYVTIENTTADALERVAETADEGYYVAAPPAEIPAGGTGRFWLQDFPGVHGSGGGSAYERSDTGRRLSFVYGCPTGILPNYASGGSSFVASSGIPPSATQTKNVVPSWGHPLFVDFLVDDSSVEPWAPRSALAWAVVAAGFWYDPNQDIIFSRMDPLQRLFGYAYAYDAAMLAIDSIIDCEPIFFDYAGKHWMIELWKGQYGLETGCEIGVYNRQIGSTSFLYDLLDSTIGQRPNDSNPSHNLFFDCANDSELLTMSSTLYRDGQKLFSRGPEKHWWLTGFKWGVLSDRPELTMDVSIECLDGAMRSALVGALNGIGYQNVQTDGNAVKFTFDRPKSPQPLDSIPSGLISVARGNQEAIVTAYNSLGLTSNDPNTVGDQAAATIGRAFAIYSAEFFKSVIASVAQQFGKTVAEAIRALSEGFNTALDEASRFITNAGYAFSSWINGLTSWLNELLDWSCVIEISNRGNVHDLVLDSSGIGHGNWAVEPPQTIPAGGTGRFWLRDPKGTNDGSDGWVRYRYVDSNGAQQTVRFDFNDPFYAWDSNAAKTSSGAFGFFTKSGSVTSGWSSRNVVKTGGHPFYVTFVWGNAPLPPDA